MTELVEAPDPDLAAGTSVGEYCIDREIGRGSFGRVYQASHPLIGKLVAIKVLAHKFSIDPEMVNRFVTEARAVNQIRHRNIIDIFSFGTLPDGRAYYVMELLEGRTLHAQLCLAGKLALAEALPILGGVARAIDAAHAQGIAHRDLKPENVFLASDGHSVQPKLLDFGIAKLLRPEQAPHKTATGIAVGTAYYMSPEQCRGRGVDHRTDFYAFGVVAYQLLTGELPLDGPDQVSILVQQVNVDPPPPSSIAPELPQGVDETIAWLMRKDPAKRPPDLATAVRALEAAATGRSEISKALDDEPSDPPPRRIPVVAKLAVGLASALLAGVVTLALLDHRSADPPAPAATPAPPRPTPAAAPTQPPTQPPTISSTIALRVDGVPAGTRVVMNGQTIGIAPGELALPRGTAPIELGFDHAGYAPATATVVPDRDDHLVVTLQRRATPPSPKRDHDSIENPFDKPP